MKSALIAAGALATATLAGLPDASAKDIRFGLTLAGPNGFVQISAPGPGGSHYGNKGYDPGSKSLGYGNKGFNQYGHRQYGYGQSYTGPYPGTQGPYGGPGHYGLPRGRAHRYCLYPNEIRRRLRYQGWYGMRVVKLKARVALVRSHRHGVRYRLKVDRCSGAVLKARPVGGYGRYGYR